MNIVEVDSWEADGEYKKTITVGNLGQKDVLFLKEFLPNFGSDRHGNSPINDVVIAEILLPYAAVFKPQLFKFFKLDLSETNEIIESHFDHGGHELTLHLADLIGYPMGDYDCDFLCRVYSEIRVYVDDDKTTYLDNVNF